MIDLLSDLHLSEGSPNALAAFTRHLQASPANAFYILGDLFDAWVGPEQAQEAIGQAVGHACLLAARQGKKVYFMPGNRDFMLDEPTLAAWQVRLLPDPFVLDLGGTRCLLTHGDALCLGDLAYQEFRRKARSTAWQHLFLQRPWPERLAFARQLRAESENAKATKSLADMDIDEAEALRWLATAEADLLIHGHTHRPATHSMSTGKVRHVLSDWHWPSNADLNEAPRAEALRLIRPEPNSDQHTLQVCRVSLA